MNHNTPLIIEVIAFILISIGINYEVVIGGDVGWLTICSGGILVAYGDIRYRVGKLEGKMDLISKSMKVIIDHKEGK